MNLRRAGVTELVLRSYRHDPGHTADDPNNSVALYPVALDHVGQMPEKIFARCSAANRIAVTSLVRVGTQLRRLLFLDFRIPTSFNSEVLVRTALMAGQQLHPNIFACGTFMRTEHSYHYVGLTPLSHRLWQKGMGIALLMGGREHTLIDTRYVGHSFTRGYGALRVCDRERLTTPTLLTFI